MSSSRRTRIRDNPEAYEDNTDQESEDGTPRPHKQVLKKRLSDAYNPDHDGSVASETGRLPLRSVNINDDAAEKRRRRKSTKITAVENSLTGLSQEGNTDADGAENSRIVKQKQQLKSIAPPSVTNVSKDVMNSNFEEWMKMATDNKINAANSWNFALIDYFHDMSLLRNNEDNSINFQRASCTLDGCVKIWTSRVDSVNTETGKLLSNLASEGRDGDGDDPEDGEEDTRKKKTHRPAATLAKDPSQLQNKKNDAGDVEFKVDPLFKKTCADFDEGGAQGLLMNHLSLGVGGDAVMRVVFDASDSMGKVEEVVVIEEPEEDVDLNELRAGFLPDLDSLEEKAICHSLAGFSFSRDAFSYHDTTFFQDNTARHDLDNDDDDDVGGPGGSSMDVDGCVQPVEDFFVGADAVNDDYGGEPFDDYPADSPSNGDPVDSQVEGHTQRGPFVPFDPRRAPSDRDLILAMTEADGDGMTDYFDQNALKNWAGPEHWKMRKTFRRSDDTAPAKPRARKEKKEAFKIDFLTPPDPDMDLREVAKELFAPVGKGGSISLPGTGPGAKKGRKKTKEKEKRDNHRLPDDMHFSSKQLVTLFLKPKFYLKMRGHQVKMNENGDGEVDEQYWAQAAAEQAAGRGDNQEDEAQIPFNTQFFHDDYDDGRGFDDYDGDGAGVANDDYDEHVLLAISQGPTRRARPETVNYATRAKRVDVRKLKDNIWRGLDIVVPPTKDENDEMETDETPQLVTDPSEARVFSQVITKLQRSYPRDKMEEISTSFCFICLLHLANEQGLKIESLPNGTQKNDILQDDVEVMRVGDIWDLKVYRDPSAIQSA